MTETLEFTPPKPAAPLRAILIAGPTASGKSALALALAKHLNGSVINADSMQVYAEMQVLTARPTEAEMEGIPHHLYGHISATQVYNTGQWVKDALAAMALVEGLGRLPILVGGTGLYFRALTEGLADIPDIADEIRQALRRRLVKEGCETLHTELKTFDPAAHARLQPTDPQRILRAHEVFAATGRSLSDWQADPVTPPLTGKLGRILLMPERSWLYDRCNRRFARMADNGARAEAEVMANLDLGVDMPATKALGLSEMMALQAGRLDPEKAVERAQQATRRYAKRQMTWFRNQMISWNSYNEQEYYNNSEKIFSYIAEIA
ncbi:MAG: tRNA (adenosine(37)-N6)-dimethylallyltransferase MiaA [Parvibaculales bacterium]